MLTLKCSNAAHGAARHNVAWIGHYARQEERAARREVALVKAKTRFLALEQITFETLRA